MSQGIEQLSAELELYSRRRDIEMAARLLQQISMLIVAPRRKEAEAMLDKRVQKKTHPLGEADIRGMLEQAKETGDVFYYSSESGLAFRADPQFAKHLFDERHWPALILYAQQWVEHGMTAGDDRGFHWLSVAFRNMGQDRAADACLELGLRLQRSIEGPGSSQHD